MTQSKNPNVAGAAARRQPPSLGSSLAGMQTGEERQLQHSDSDKSVRVRYYSEQAKGDNGLPAEGYTIGHFEVHGPGKNDYDSFRHSPHGPTLMGAKPYAADQAAKRIGQLFSDRRPSGEPGLTSL